MNKLRHPCSGAKQADALQAGNRPRGLLANERGTSACGSGQGLRTLKERSEKECVIRKSRSTDCAPDRYPKGRDFRLGERSE